MLIPIEKFPRMCNQWTNTWLSKSSFIRYLDLLAIEIIEKLSEFLNLDVPKLVTPIVVSPESNNTSEFSNTLKGSG